MKRKYLGILFISLLITACTKKYTYIEICEETKMNGLKGIIEKDPRTFNAENDSLAYVEAFKYFCIAQNVSNDLKENIDNKYLTTPLKFKLINPSNIDISGTVMFSTKNQAELKIKDDIFKKPAIISQDSFQILRKTKNSNVTNYDILLKHKNINEIKATEFIKIFRQFKCYGDCNINLFDNDVILPLLGKYPLENSEYLIFADHFIASSSFDAPESIWWYPFQDIKYKELGGKNWKKKAQ